MDQEGIDGAKAGFGGIDCDAREGMTRPKVCYNFARVEGAAMERRKGR